MSARGVWRLATHLQPAPLSTTNDSGTICMCVYVNVSVVVLVLVVVTFGTNAVSIGG